MTHKVTVTFDNAEDCKWALDQIQRGITQGSRLSGVSAGILLDTLAKAKSVSTPRTAANFGNPVNREEFFAEAFTDPVTREPYRMPATLRTAATRICQSYGIRGTCDPMYIANVIAVELGLGDGLSNFREGA